MNNNLGKRVMNFNDSRQNSQPPIQMHNFMPMTSSSAHIDYQQSEAERRASFVDKTKQNMESFWRERLSEICDTPTDVRTPHTLPLARIKKVMKSDKNVKMMSAETPMVIAKACEIFVMEVTARAWMHAQENKRNTMQRNDIANAIAYDRLFAFLSNIVPVEELHDHAHHHLHHQEAEAGPVAPYDHQMAFPMNLHHHNPNPDLSGRKRGMQNNPTFPPPSSSDDGLDPYHIFKEYFQ